MAITMLLLIEPMATTMLLQLWFVTINRYDDEQSTDGYLYLKGNKKRYWCVVKDDLFMFFNTKQVMTNRFMITNNDIINYRMLSNKVGYKRRVVDLEHQEGGCGHDS